MNEIEDNYPTPNFPKISVPAGIIPVKQLNRYGNLVKYLSQYKEENKWVRFLCTIGASPNPRYWITPKEMAELLSVSRSRVYQLIALGKLKSKQLRKKKRHCITLHAVNVFLKA